MISAPTDRSQLQRGASGAAGGLGGAGQALLGQQVLHDGDVGGDIQGLVAEEGLSGGTKPTGGTDGPKLEL